MRGQDRQLRPDLRLRPPQARRRRRLRLQRLRASGTTRCACYGATYDDNDNLINPSQYIQGKDRYKKDSHELRLALAEREPLALRRPACSSSTRSTTSSSATRSTASAAQYSITGWPDTIWLTKQEREDHDEAVFGELSYDFTDMLTATVGVPPLPRREQPEGLLRLQRRLVRRRAVRRGVCVAQFGDDPANWPSFNGAPCTDLRQGRSRRPATSASANLTWQIDADQDGLRHLVRRLPSGRHQPPRHAAAVPVGLPDQLRARLEDHAGPTTALTFNGAVFHQEWEDFQFSHPRRQRPDRDQERQPGQHRRPRNGPELGGDLQPADQRRRGVLRRQADRELLRLHRRESDVPRHHTRRTRRSATMSRRRTGSAGRHAAAGHAGVQGQRHRAATTSTSAAIDAYVQGAVVHVGERKSDLRIVEREILGELDVVHRGRSLRRHQPQQLVAERLRQQRVRRARRDLPLRQLRRNGLRCLGRRARVSERPGLHRDQPAAHASASGSSQKF